MTKYIKTLIMLTPILFGCSGKNEVNNNSSVYEINGTNIYVSKRRWGISGGDEITIISPNKNSYKDVITAFNHKYDGLICFSVDISEHKKDSKLIIKCPRHSIPVEQKNIKIWGNAEVILEAI